ncbi:MAG: hypothetical protein ABH815_02045 [Candidatus Omnitrophota bacterium]
MMIKEKGSILIFTLWVLIILAVLSVMLSRRASTDIKLAKYESDNIKATYLCRAGVMKMLAELAKGQNDNDYDSLNEDWNRGEDNPKELRIAGGTIYYGASDEMGRLNLNGVGLTKENLINLGIDDETISGNIVKYGKDKKFEFMEELFLVDGMTREYYLQIKDFVTIYRENDYRVNINTADEEVLNAVLGDEGLVTEVLDYRKGPDGDFKNIGEISTIDGLNPHSALFTVSSIFFRIWAKTSFSEGKTIVKSVEAVVDRSSGKIYHWKEF